MSWILKTENLEIRIEEPGIGVNDTCRFDRAGFITSVILDGKYQFCSREPENLKHPCSGGFGLCSEYKMFGVDQEALVGEFFPKLGIGLLKKESEDDYVFYRKYEMQPFDIYTNRTESSIEFVTESNKCMGYAVLQKKKVEVAGNSITMSMNILNEGEKTVRFEEYCHNFLTLEGLPINDKYSLEMNIKSQANKLKGNSGVLIGKGRGFSFSGYSNTASSVKLSEDEIENDIPFRWVLTNKISPLRVLGEVFNIPNKIVIWTIDHIVSPEVFCRFEINPGEQASWVRKWSFEMKDSSIDKNY